MRHRHTILKKLEHKGLELEFHAYVQPGRIRMRRSVPSIPIKMGVRIVKKYMYRDSSHPRRLQDQEVHLTCFIPQDIHP